MHNLVSFYRAGWPGDVGKGTQKALDLHQKMTNLKVPQGFYDMAAMIGSHAGVKSPTTDGLTFLDEAASLDSPSALTELGELCIYVASQDELGLKYMNCAAGQGYAPANYGLAMYYRSVAYNCLKAAGHYLPAVNQGNNDAAFLMSGVSDKTSPDASRMWYAPDERLHKLYDGIYD